MIRARFERQTIAIDPNTRGISDYRASDTSPADALSVRIITCDEHAAWDAALLQSPQACPFLTTDWLIRAAAAIERRPILVGCFSHGQLIAGLTGTIANGSAKAATESCTLERIDTGAYNGVWIVGSRAERSNRAGRRDRAVLTALATATASMFRSAEIDCHPAFIDARPFTWNAWQCGVRYTYQTDLSPLDESHFDPDIVRRARRADEAAIRFDDRVAPDEFDRLWSITHERQGLRRPIGSEAAIKLLRGLVGRGDCTIQGTRLADGRLVAANVVLYGDRTAYYWLAGSDPALAGAGANQLCLLRTLRAAASRAAAIDWVGANTPGVAEFKESFGPQLVPYYRLRSEPRPPVSGDSRDSVRRTNGHPRAAHADRVQQAYDQLWQDFGAWTPSPTFCEIFDQSVLTEVRARLNTGGSDGDIDILEIGCGHGTWAERIYTANPEHAGRIRYQGIDFSQPRIELGRQRLSIWPTAELFVADAETFEPRRPVDLILSIEVISHLPPERHTAWLNRWHHWLKPGGCAIVIDKERYSRHACRVAWDRFSRRLPSFISGRRYYFPEHFTGLLQTLHYPSFARLRRAAESIGYVSRPVIRQAAFRALICQRPH